MAIATINPVTGETLKEFAALTAAEIEARLQRAASVFRAYRRTSFAERAGWMLRVAEMGVDGIISDDTRFLSESFETERE